MLLAGRELLFNDPFAFFVLMGTVSLALLASISVHEFSHAAAAYRLGDATAQRLGRLTLNPRKHLDPTGTIMLLVVGFGWGKPVPVNGAALRNGRRSMALVALAGPASNIALALAVALVFRLGLLDFSRATLSGVDLLAYAAVLGWYLVVLNLILAVFNLLPVAPLDGSGILRGIVPKGWLPALRRIEVFGPMVLLVIIGLRMFTNVSVLGFVFDPVLHFANTLVGA